MMLNFDPQRTFSEWNFASLIYREWEIVEGVVESGRRFQRFLEAREIGEAVEAMARFGARLADAFNENVGGLYAGASLRPLGTLLFVETAKILDPNLFAGLRPTAMLESLFLKPTSDFAPKDFIEGQLPPADQIALQQRILSAGKSNA